MHPISPRPGICRPHGLQRAAVVLLCAAVLVMQSPMLRAEESVGRPPQAEPQDAAAAHRIRSARLPPQGVFESVALDEDWKPRLAQIAEAGFSLVLNYDVLPPPSDVTTAQLLEYARYADRHGLKIIWSMKDKEWWKDADLVEMFPRLSADLEATESDAFLAKFIEMLKAQPATWGYYIVDEAERPMAPAVIRFAEKIRAADPTHPTFTVNFGMQFENGDMQAFAPAATYIGFDEYPIGQYADDKEMWTSMNQLYTGVVAWVKTTGKAFVPVLQANDVVEAYPNLIKNWQWHRWPTIDQMKKQRDMILAISREHQVQVPAVLWYSYYDIMKHRPEQFARLKAAAFAPVDEAPH